MANLMLRESHNYNGTKLPRVIVVPDFVFRSMRRNNTNIVNIGSLAVMRDIISFEDLCLWEMINENLFIGNPSNKAFLSTSTIFDLNKESGPKAEEYAKFVRPLSGSVERVESALTYLTGQSNGDVPWKIIQTPAATVVVVAPGFTSYLQDLRNRKEFVTAYLKHVNKMIEESELSNLPVFREYLSLVRL